MRPPGQGRDDTGAAHEHDVHDDQKPDDQRQEHDVPHQHLAEVEDVEEGADARGVEAVLGLAADPLRGEVLLAEIAGESRADRDQERDRARDPGQRAPPPPGSHEELAPQVADHEEEEQLGAPEMQAVAEMTHARDVPPTRARKRQHSARGQHEHERSQGQHTEHIDPRRHIDRLRLRQQPLRRQRGHRRLPHPPRPRARLAGSAHRRPRPRGNGTIIASANTTSIATITTRFASVIRNQPECR